MFLGLPGYVFVGTSWPLHIDDYYNYYFFMQAKYSELLESSEQKQEGGK